MSGAVVFGLCALSFAAGCVLTAVMLRREHAPEAVPERAVEVAEESREEERWPSERYVSQPIHRNPVVGIPAALPPSEPSRPALTLVPDAEEPSKLDEVRRMRVVRGRSASEPVVQEPVVDEDPRVEAGQEPEAPVAGAVELPAQADPPSDPVHVVPRKSNF